MSCLRIKLPQANKAWKSFISKLQTKLHKLNKPKTIGKPNNNRLQIAVSKTTRLWPSLFSGQRLLSKKRRPNLPFGYQRYYVSKTKVATAPVYIDKLFKEAPLTQLVGYIPQQILDKNKKLLAEATAEAGTSNARERQEDDTCDLGRSIDLASPMVNEIDARAEEFITSFRAEMDRQEMIARNL